MIEVLGALAQAVVLAFMVVSAMILNGSPRVDTPLVRNIWAELRPFYLPAALFQLGLEIFNVEPDVPTQMVYVLAVVSWWMFKNIDDDDRWRRRRRKAAEKIRALASGRLTVVPTS